MDVPPSSTAAPGRSSPQTSAPQVSGNAISGAAVDVLRFATAGAVDDGKSTLIGRLLHDSRSLLVDQLEAVELASRERGDDSPDLAMLTDGLRAEREQGITIDVAHRYFETARRAFIIADTPGHAEYTRNMVTGSSHADLAIVLVDARHGLTEQSRRHAALAGLLRVPRLVLAVNKMDLVDDDQGVFDRTARDFAALIGSVSQAHTTAIPISALRGDNVVARSEAMPWYEGPALLEHLENVDIDTGEDAGFRFPVQHVLRAADYRGYAGRVVGGAVAVGDRVRHLPSGRSARVAAIDTADGGLGWAPTSKSVALRLDDELDIGRGDMLCAEQDPCTATESARATVCWMSSRFALRPGSRLVLKHTTSTVRAVVTDVEHRWDVTSLEREQADELGLNDIGSVGLRLDGPVFADAYQRDRLTGCGLLIEENSNATVAALMFTHLG